MIEIPWEAANPWLPRPNGKGTTPMAIKTAKLMPRGYASEQECRVFGYLRVHDSDTEPEAQEALLGSVEALFIDATSETNSSQPQLKAMLTVARRGDVLRVATIDRLGLTIMDAINTLKLLTARGIEVQFGDQRLICQPTSLERSTAEERDWLVFIHLRDADQALRKARTVLPSDAEGMWASDGGTVGAPVLSIDNVELAERQIEAHIPPKKVAEGLGVSPATLFLALHRHGDYSNYPQR